MKRQIFLARHGVIYTLYTSVIQIIYFLPVSLLFLIPISIIDINSEMKQRLYIGVFALLNCVLLIRNNLVVVKDGYVYYYSVLGKKSRLETKCFSDFRWINSRDFRKSKMATGTPYVLGNVLYFFSNHKKLLCFKNRFGIDTVINTFQIERFLAAIGDVSVQEDAPFYPRKGKGNEERFIVKMSFGAHIKHYFSNAKEAVLMPISICIILFVTAGNHIALYFFLVFPVYSLMFYHSLLTVLVDYDNKVIITSYFNRNNSGCFCFEGAKKAVLYPDWEERGEVFEDENCLLIATDYAYMEDVVVLEMKHQVYLMFSTNRAEEVVKHINAVIGESPLQK